MRWELNESYGMWRKAYAWLPRIVQGHIIWLEYYEFNEDVTSLGDVVSYERLVD